MADVGAGGCGGASHSPSRGSVDSQSGSVALALAALVVVLMAGGLASAAGAIVTTRQRAASAADLAALAGAGRVLDGMGTACAEAESFARLNGAAQIECAPGPDDERGLPTVSVAVEVDLPGVVGRILDGAPAEWRIRAEARAGLVPAPDR